MAEIQIYNITNHKKGDTFKGLDFTINANGSPKDLTGTVISIDFKFGKKTGNVKKHLETGSGITITDAVAGKFRINAFNVLLNDGLYYYDIQFNTAGVINTYIEGTWEITQDVTD